MKRILLGLFLASNLFSQTDEERVQEIASNSIIYTVMPTGSMKPTFDENYLLLAQVQKFNSLRVNDIIIWKSPVGYKWDGGIEYKLIVHRIWATSSKGSLVLTKGDNNPHVDDLIVTEDMYVGTVVGFIKK